MESVTENVNFAENNKDLIDSKKKSVAENVNFAEHNNDLIDFEPMIPPTY